MRRIPAQVLAVVNLQGGVRRCRGQQLPLLPWDHRVCPAVNHEHGPGKTPYCCQVVEVIPQQKRRRPVVRRERIQRRKSGLEDERAQCGGSKLVAAFGRLPRCPVAFNAVALRVPQACRRDDAQVSGGAVQGKRFAALVGESSMPVE